MIIKNLKDTSNCNCMPKRYKGSWIKRYTKTFYKDENIKLICCEKDCNETGTDGSHVVEYTRERGKRFIVPLCNKHNRTYRIPIKLKEGTPRLLLQKCKCRYVPPLLVKTKASRNIDEIVERNESDSFWKEIAV